MSAGLRKQNPLDNTPSPAAAFPVVTESLVGVTGVAGNAECAPAKRSVSEAIVSPTTVRWGPAWTLAAGHLPAVYAGVMILARKTATAVLTSAQPAECANPAHPSVREKNAGTMDAVGHAESVRKTSRVQEGCVGVRHPLDRLAKVYAAPPGWMAHAGATNNA